MRCASRPTTSIARLDSASGLKWRRLSRTANRCSRTPGMRWLSGKGAYDLGSCAGDAFGQVRDLAEGQDKGHEAYALLVSVVALQLRIRQDPIYFRQ